MLSYMRVVNLDCLKDDLVAVKEKHPVVTFLYMGAHMHGHGGTLPSPANVEKCFSVAKNRQFIANRSSEALFGV